MAVARRSHPRGSAAVIASMRRGASLVAHPTRVFEKPNEDEFYQVRSCRCWRCRSSPKPTLPVPPALDGLCFNCLASNHVKADCVFPSRCFNCRCEGHRAFACPLPLRTRVGKRERSPSQMLSEGGCATLPDLPRHRCWLSTLISRKSWKRYGCNRESDRFIWRLMPDGNYSASSAYRSFFLEMSSLLGAKEL